MATITPPLVVKIGGSLAASGCLAPMLEVLAAARRPIILTPGGGPFADKVRDLQRVLRFDDVAAHRMAMLGMHQMAEAIAGLNRAFAPADSLERISEAIDSGLRPVWMPLPMMDADMTVPSSWATTSDTLAARLAELLGGAPLALLKSVDVDRFATAADLARNGVVDDEFPAIVARAKIVWRIFGPSDDADLRAALADARAPISAA